MRYCTPRPCQGVVGSGCPSAAFLIGGELWAADLLQYTTLFMVCNEHWGSNNTQPHC